MPGTSAVATAADVEEASHPAVPWVRRAVLAAMALLVAIGLTGLLGVHTSEASSSHDGYTLTLHYPAVARAGLDTTWRVEVTHSGGFGKDLTLAVTGDYFDIFETQGFHPNPSEETRNGHILYLTFTAPPGDTFVVDFDAYIQPASQRGRAATVALVEGTTPVVAVRYRTRILP